MGRRERTVITDNHALEELVEWLRSARHGTRQTYVQLAARAAFHATTLQRAASGRTVPRHAVVVAYAQACGASTEHAQRLWRKARYEERRAKRGGQAVPAPRPDLIRDLADLSAGLRELYEKAGAPSLRELEGRAGEYGLLPRSSLHRIVHRQTVPHGQAQFMGFLQACDVPKEERAPWLGAWNRAWQHHRDTHEAQGLSSIPRAAWKGSAETLRIFADLPDTVMRATGFPPVQSFPGPFCPWKCVCTACGTVVSMRLAHMVNEQAGCPRCGRSAPDVGLGSDNPRNVLINLSLDRLQEAITPQVPDPGELRIAVADVLKLLHIGFTEEGEASVPGIPFHTVLACLQGRQFPGDIVTEKFVLFGLSANNDLQEKASDLLQTVYRYGKRKEFRTAPESLRETTRNARGPKETDAYAPLKQQSLKRLSRTRANSSHHPPSRARGTR
ncbi:helix-turn-helix domain-containing protein [Streptomyces chrestomyceticus]|uniref:helix-turn-helix domain-containing protein n=1 Tax=Streptomyces chrestomyceticus TaxID=68185 RepID=UPI0033D8AA1C